MRTEPVRPAPKRLAQRAAARRHGKSNALPQQEFEDIQSVFTALDFGCGVDIGYELGSAAASQRHLTHAMVDEQVPDAAGREDVLEQARFLTMHKGPLHWPMHADQVPAPNFLLADEVAAIAEQCGPLTRETAGVHWMAVHHALCQLLSHLKLFPGTSYTPEAVAKEATKLLTSSTALPPGTLYDTLRGMPEVVHRRTSARSLEWRDVLAAAYASNNARAKLAADKVYERMCSLYAARPVVPHLERRTWSMKPMPDIVARRALVDKARAEVSEALPGTTPEGIWRTACVVPDETRMPSGWHDWKWGQRFAWDIPTDSDALLDEALAWDSESDMESDGELDVATPSTASSELVSMQASPTRSSSSSDTEPPGEEASIDAPADPKRPPSPSASRPSKRARADQPPDDTQSRPQRTRRHRPIVQSTYQRGF